MSLSSLGDSASSALCSLSSELRADASWVAGETWIDPLNDQVSEACSEGKELDGVRGRLNREPG